MRERLLSSGIALTVIAMASLLAYAYATGFTGYATGYCSTFSFVNVASAHGELDVSPDQRRVMDLEQLVVQLSNYKKKHGSYPIYAEVSDTTEMSELLAIPNDPCFEFNEQYTYQYISDADGSDFIVRTLLSDTGYRYVHAQYPSVREGEQLGLWCGEGLHKRALCLGADAVVLIVADPHVGHKNHVMERQQVTSLPIEVTLSTTTVPGEISVVTPAFTFAETLVDTKHADGFGHGHVYIDGVKVGRLYGNTLTLPDIEPGMYEVSVVLNTNDHQTYVRDGEEVKGSVEVVVGS